MAKEPATTTNNDTKEVQEYANVQEAFLAAQSEMGRLVKNAKGNYNEYANLAAVTGIVIPALNKHGLSLMTFFEDIQADVPRLTNRISDAAGDYIDQDYPIVCMQRNDPQKFGGAVTYARRYSLMAMVGLAPEDDDGHSASQPASKPTGRPAAQTSRQAPAKTSGKSTSQANQSSAPSEPERVECEVPGCHNTVRKEAEQANRELHEGHLICQFHSENGSWQTALAKPQASKPDAVPIEDELFEGAEVAD